MQPQSTKLPPQLPAFVFPNAVRFFLHDPSTHKQVLSLYNPYDFPIKFNVLCTAPNKYKVIEPDGKLNAMCYTDIVVRHIAVTENNCEITDKFRVQILKHSTKQVLGKRDIEATLIHGTPDMFERSTPDPETFQQFPRSENKQQPSYALLAQNKTSVNGTNYVALVAGIICIVGLLLPTEGESGHRVPDYLHLSINIKLILSFVLGMVTVSMLRL